MTNEQVENVMSLAFELARIREKHGAQSGMYLSEVRALRAEVERLAAQAAPTELSTSGDFIVRTNTDYAAWCATYYAPEALDDRGMMSLHGLWAWQEQERRKLAAQPSQAPVEQAGEYPLHQQAADAIELLLEESIEHRLVKHAANPEIVYGAEQTVLRLRKFCAVNAGKRIPADGKIGSAA